MTSAQFLAGFARALRTARLKKGLTQETVAETAGVHPTYVSRVETGAYIPTISVAFRLSHAVGRSFSSLVREAEERSPTNKSN
jgi:XRE family transcriptional regulator, regulator of sulfur utilization